MNCPQCKSPMSCDEPEYRYQVYICEDCNVLKQYHDDTLVYESMPEAPMKPPARTVKVKRTLVYEGDEEWVYRTIGGRAITNTADDAGHEWLNNGDLQGPRKIYEESIEIIGKD